MTSDLKARLDAMVGAEIKRQLEGCEDSFAGPHLTNALRSICLSEMARADAAEAQVESLKLETKALTAERDSLKRAVSTEYECECGDKAIARWVCEGCSAASEDSIRAALKLGGEK